MWLKRASKFWRIVQRGRHYAKGTLEWVMIVNLPRQTDSPTVYQRNYTPQRHSDALDDRSTAREIPQKMGNWSETARGQEGMAPWRATTDEIREQR